jgi:hypothetical protein
VWFPSLTLPRPRRGQLRAHLLIFACAALAALLLAIASLEMTPAARSAPAIRTVPLERTVVDGGQAHHGSSGSLRGMGTSPSSANRQATKSHRTGSQSTSSQSTCTTTVISSQTTSGSSTVVRQASGGACTACVIVVQRTQNGSHVHEVRRQSGNCQGGAAGSGGGRISQGGGQVTVSQGGTHISVSGGGTSISVSQSGGSISVTIH